MKNPRFDSRAIYDTLHNFVPIKQKASHFQTNVSHFILGFEGTNSLSWGIFFHFWMNFITVWKDPLPALFSFSCILNCREAGWEWEERPLDWGSRGLGSSLQLHRQTSLGLGFLVCMTRRSDRTSLRRAALSSLQIISISPDFQFQLLVQGPPHCLQPRFKLLEELAVIQD